MKKVGIILVVLAFVLIVGGVGYVFLNSSDDDTASNETTKKMDEDRNYTVVEEVAADTMNSVSTPENFATTATAIGLESPRCEAVEGNETQQYCSAFHNGYTNLDLQDIIAITYENNLLDTFSGTFYFTESDFTADKIVSISNSILNNFFGTPVDSGNVTEVMNGLNAVMSDETPVAAEEYQIGDYTERINMQYVKDRNIYVVQYYVILSSEYHLS